MEEFNIDEIMRKDAAERTSEEIEFMIEWKSEQMFKAKEVKRAEEDRRRAYDKIIAEEKKLVTESLAIMQQMADDARQRLEEASNG